MLMLDLHLYLQVGVLLHTAMLWLLSFVVELSCPNLQFMRACIHACIQPAISIKQASKQAKYPDITLPWSSINQPDSAEIHSSLVQMRVERLGSLRVVMTGVDDILRVSVAGVVLLGSLDVLLGFAG